MKKTFDNYIFDLYGTLIDLSTDERSDIMWERMAAYYSTYGADYSAKALRKRFLKYDRKEREKLSEEIGSKFPEIKLEKVFVKLLLEADDVHESISLIDDKPLSVLKEEYAADKEGTIDVLSKGGWAYFVSNMFRIESMQYIRLFPNTLKMLKKLKKKGKKVYLLSNAQKIFTYPELERFGLLEFFDAVYISSDASIMKPDPAFLKMLIEKEGLDPEKSVMVGNDVRSDNLIALMCGMNSILVNTFNEDKKTVKKKIDKAMKASKADEDIRPITVMSGNIGMII